MDYCAKVRDKTQQEACLSFGKSFFWLVEGAGVSQGLLHLLAAKSGVVEQVKTFHSVVSYVNSQMLSLPPDGGILTVK